jgi:hypothetical protein
MDVVVTRAENGWQVWDLTDLLGRPMGRITKHPGPRFIIEPNERLRSVTETVAPGPYASLDEALTEIEKHSSLVCRCAPEASHGESDPVTLGSTCLS